MKQKPRTMDHAERQEVWLRFRRGESLRAIASVLGRHDSSVGDLVRAHGGVAPVPDRRAGRALSMQEREVISRGMASGVSFRQIAIDLGRPTCTVSREVQRHGGRSRYRATLADERAWSNARRPKACRIALEPQLQALVTQKLLDDWSPQQIASWLKLEHADRPELQVSHETIYRTLFIQSRGALRKELLAHLRSRQPQRRARGAPGASAARGQIKDAVSIRERPASVEDRSVPGHWEGDLICGANNSYVGTLVERHSRFVMLLKLQGKDTASVVGALTQCIQRLPAALARSLTWDRGMELADHAAFTVETGVQVYFCDPRSPWQRGSNENTNGLLRQYLPRKDDLSRFTQEQLDEFARKLNTRPRQTLGFRTPAYTYERVLH